MLAGAQGYLGVAAWRGFGANFIIPSKAIALGRRELHKSALQSNYLKLVLWAPVPGCPGREGCIVCGLDSNQVAGDETGSKSAVLFTPRSALLYRSRAAEQLRCRVFFSCFDFDCRPLLWPVRVCGVRMMTRHLSQADIRG